jgi:thiamine biosynthesis protein ThiS
MIDVHVNGKAVTLPGPVPVSELLARLGYTNDFVAVAIGRTHVPRREFATAMVGDQAEVDILAPMAGG